MLRQRFGHRPGEMVCEGTLIRIPDAGDKKEGSRDWMNAQAPKMHRQAIKPAYRRVIMRSKRLVRAGSALISCRARMRWEILPCDQLRAETGMLLMTATRYKAEAKTPAPYSPT